MFIKLFFQFNKNMNVYIYVCGGGGGGVADPNVIDKKKSMCKQKKALN